MEIALTAIGYEESRVVSQVVRDGSVQELAVGVTTSHLMVKTPSGKIWIAVVPEAMITDLLGEDREYGNPAGEAPPPA